MLPSFYCLSSHLQTIEYATNIIACLHLEKHLRQFNPQCFLTKIFLDVFALDWASSSSYSSYAASVAVVTSASLKTFITTTELKKRQARRKNSVVVA